ncbi:hypothetical protein AMAG_17723 [Allomyces macrogynus ATCC 38327]|uniref:Uncharacterized protein n=1 Tax=Allomyces macrogynus (strain ATCC 38327) TaxID=578462 RepID=A0A0L0RXW6_ALLM3|nr:hypothetical protein AMAG_17723 [Allomyces macrogynus ATCC 38327]|eukprot:KNE54944.1 hypothetical protein AMAG_17723 [Allomyces macrogynus ATCC 38327]
MQLESSGPVRHEHLPRNNERCSRSASICLSFSTRRGPRAVPLRRSIAFGRAARRSETRPLYSIASWAVTMNALHVRPHPPSSITTRRARRTERAMIWFASIARSLPPTPAPRHHLPSSEAGPLRAWAGPRRDLHVTPVRRRCENRGRMLHSGHFSDVGDQVVIVVDRRARVIARRGCQTRWENTDHFLLAAMPRTAPGTTCKLKSGCELSPSKMLRSLIQCRSCLGCYYLGDPESPRHSNSRND